MSSNPDSRLSTRHSHEEMRNAEVNNEGGRLEGVGKERDEGHPHASDEEVESCGRRGAVYKVIDRS